MNSDKAKEYKLTATNNEFDACVIHTSKEAELYARQFYFDDISIYESFFMIMLNAKSKTIGWCKLSQGGINGTVVDTRILMKFAIDTLCNGVVLIHNHPSGDCTPSPADISITKKLKESFKLLDISFFDHIILAEESFYSLADNGVL